MKFEDILFTIQTGAGLIALATGNPLLAAALDAGLRLVKLGRDAYESGRERGEWTEAEEKQFDEVVTAEIIRRPHWKPKAD